MHLSIRSKRWVMAAKKPDKETVYRWIRVSGQITLIPIVLCAGPLGGYYAGEWLTKAFHLPGWTTNACVLIGLAGAIRETIRILRIALKETR